MVREILAQSLAKARALLGLAQAIHRDLEVGGLDPHLGQQCHQHGDHLRVDGRRRQTEHFGPDLMELAQTPALGALVAEHGAEVVPAGYWFAGPL